MIYIYKYNQMYLKKIPQVIEVFVIVHYSCVIIVVLLIYIYGFIVILSERQANTDVPASSHSHDKFQLFHCNIRVFNTHNNLM